MIPLIENEISIRHKFITKDELIDIISISELTPGPISINCATFIGYKVSKFMGSLVSTIAVILPSFIIILLISFFIDFIKNFQIISRFLQGIKVGVILILISSVSKLNSKNKKVKYCNLIIPFVVLICLFTKISSIKILFLSIIIHLVIFTLNKNWRRL